VAHSFLKRSSIDAGLQVITAVTMKNYILWDIMPCGPGIVADVS
jgi:hypothetical protein